MATIDERVAELEQNLQRLTNSMTMAFGTARAWHEALDAVLPTLAGAPSVAGAIADHLEATRAAMALAGAPASALNGFDGATALILARFEASGLHQARCDRAH